MLYIHKLDVGQYMFSRVWYLANLNATKQWISLICIYIFSRIYSQRDCCYSWALMKSEAHTKTRKYGCFLSKCNRNQFPGVLKAIWSSYPLCKCILLTIGHRLHDRNLDYENELIEWKCPRFTLKKSQTVALECRAYAYIV